MIYSHCFLLPSKAFEPLSALELAYGPMLPLHLRDVPTCCRHPPVWVLRGVSSELDKEHYLLGRVDIYRMISWLLLRMKDPSRDWSHL